MTGDADGPARAHAWRRAYAGARRGPDWPAEAMPAGEPGRAQADAAAAWARWHDAGVAADMPLAPRPWYILFERARVEALASADLPGMQANLGDVGPLLPALPESRALYRTAREVFGGRAPARTGLAPAPAPTTRTGWWSRRGEAAAASAWPTDDEILATLAGAAWVLGDAREFARVVAPLAARLAAAAARPAAATMRVPSLPSALEAGATQELERDGATNPPRQSSAERARDAGYAVFSTRLDEVVDAAHLAPPGDHAALALTDVQRRQVEHLAQRLQRRLRAASRATWSFDEEEGRLDNRRLARLVVPGAGTAVFRQERATPVPEACVTLLVDQSGSMRGERQRIVALAVEFAMRTLERCGVRCEVLGYTTRFGVDNPLAQAWRAQGAPARPGRLNALRHVVYKPAARPWRQARAGLGLLLREGFGHENVDGESLAWAARRLLAQPEPRKILVVLCDGAPYDEATARAMGRGFLEDHLRAVIRQLEAGPIRLVALGARRDAGRFYRHALELVDADAVADTLFAQLGDLLVRPDAAARRAA